MTSLYDLMIRTPNLPCRLAPDVWFSDQARDRDAAARLCQTCPLREACAADALERREPYGVWGGTTAADRAGFWTGEPHRFDETGRLRLLCGSERAYRAHFKFLEQPCEECTAAHDELIERGRRERLAAEHVAGGSARGAWLHRQLGEPVCEPCGEAFRAREAAARRARAARGLQGARVASGSPGASGRLRGAPAGVQGLPIAS